MAARPGRRPLIEDPLFWAVAVPAVTLIGLSKGGFSGMGALSLPMFVLVMPPLQAAAILLPILIVQDAVSVWAFRHDWDGFVLGWALPGAVIGIVLGYVFAASVSTDAVLGVVGGVSMLFGAHRLWVGRRSAPQAVASNSPGWVGSLFGVASGFTSQVAHAGAPPLQLWLLPRHLPRDVLIGTTAIYFAVVNWIKVPAYIALGQFTRPNLIAAAALLPVAIISTMAGVWLARRVAPERFYTAIYALMILVGIKLSFDAVA